MPEAQNLLAAAPRLWQQMRSEFEEAASADAALADQGAVPAEELKKVAKWLQHGITKFGASAAVAEGEEIEKGLKPIAEEVIKSFTAALGTLLSLKRGAGASLLVELRTTGADLTAALDELGQAVGTAGMAVCAGKVLERFAKEQGSFAGLQVAPKVQREQTPLNIKPRIRICSGVPAPSRSTPRL